MDDKIKSIGEKPKAEVSPEMLNQARILRETARQIETGFVTAVALIAVDFDAEDNSSNVRRAYACQYGRFALVGGVACIFESMTKEVNDGDL